MRISARGRVRASSRTSQDPMTGSSAVNERPESCVLIEVPPGERVFKADPTDVDRERLLRGMIDRKQIESLVAIRIDTAQIVQVVGCQFQIT